MSRYLYIAGPMRYYRAGPRKSQVVVSEVEVEAGKDSLGKGS
jgi:hypothetical protein